jgi:hypothetical protein
MYLWKLNIDRQIILLVESHQTPAVHDVQQSHRKASQTDMPLLIYLKNIIASNIYDK